MKGAGEEMLDYKKGEGGINQSGYPALHGNSLGGVKGKLLNTKCPRLKEKSNIGKRTSR